MSIVIEPLARNLASSIKKTNPEQTSSIEIIQYGIVIFLNVFIVLCISLFIGWVTGKFSETCITIISFAILRFFSGGYHARTAMQCIILSTVIMTTLPHIPINHQWNLGLLIISLLLVSIFAPSEIKNQTRIPEKYHRWLKYISIMIIMLNFLYLSDIVTKSFFVQALLLIKFRR